MKIAPTRVCLVGAGVTLHHGTRQELFSFVVLTGTPGNFQLPGFITVSHVDSVIAAALDPAVAQAEPMQELPVMPPVPRKQRRKPSIRQ